jgi:hypothetical protein
MQRKGVWQIPRKMTRAGQGRYVCLLWVGRCDAYSDKMIQTYFMLFVFAEEGVNGNGTATAKKMPVGNSSEVKKVLRKLHNEEVHNLCYTLE